MPVAPEEPVADHNTLIKVAWISFASTVVAAVIGGLFVVTNKTPSNTPPASTRPSITASGSVISNVGEGGVNIVTFIGPQVAKALIALQQELHEIDQKLADNQQIEEEYQVREKFLRQQTQALLEAVTAIPK